MPWWGITLIAIGSAMVGATLGAFTIAILAAGSGRYDDVIRREDEHE